MRKQDYELDLADIMQFPVWEYALDKEGVTGQDERTVRPYHAVPLDPHSAYLIVRASFRLADGTEMKGYIRPIPIVPRAPKLMQPLVPADLDPIVITERGPVAFWYGASKPDSEQILSNYSILGRRPSEVFPIMFGSDVEVEGSIAEGTLEGFLYCDRDLPDIYRMGPSDIKEVK